MKLWMIYLIIVNLAALVLMYSDKQRAIRHHWRIPERTLFLSAIIGGSIGAIAGMYLFHQTLVLRHRYARDSRGTDRGMDAAVPLDRTVWRNSKAIIDNNPR